MTVIKESSVWKDLGIRLEEFRDLQDNWDGRGTEAPNEVAFSAARIVFNELMALDLRPDKIVASADNGIGFCFVCGPKYAEIECFNRGSIVVMTRNRAMGERHIKEIFLDEVASALNGIKRYLME